MITLQEKINKLELIKEKRHDFKAFRSQFHGFSKYKVEKSVPTEYYVIDFRFIKLYYCDFKHLKLGLERIVNSSYKPRSILTYKLINNRYIPIQDTAIDYFKQLYF